MALVKNYLSLIKFSHTIFAMPFAFIGFFIGISHLNSIPNTSFLFIQNESTWQKTILFFQWKWSLFVLVLLCMIFARNAAMAFNRYIDRHFDALNPRTAIREIPAGILNANKVLWFTILNCLLFITCTFFINKLCFYLSPVALVTILGYSYTKRFTALCHIILGLGLSLAPIGAYIAVTGKFDILPILFSCIVILWVSGFDIMYALQDAHFDKTNKLYSIPSLLGTKNGLLVSRLLHSLCAFILVCICFFQFFGTVFIIGCVLFIGLLFTQHRLVNHQNLSKINLAFMTTNGIASVVFAAFTIIDLVTR